jgi:hypothetical protein
VDAVVADTRATGSGHPQPAQKPIEETTMNAIRPLAAAVAVVALAAAAPAQAQTFAPIDISTANPGWQASYSGFSGPAYRYSNGCPLADCISISSTGYGDGEFVGGGTANDFTGLWTASLAFDVPFAAEGVQMNLQLHGVDDRASFSLNGIPLITQHRQDGPYGATLSLQGGALIAGATNQLVVEVANLPFFSTVPSGFLFAGDGTAASFSGTVSAVPEPGTWAMMAAGVGWLLSRRLRGAVR